MIKEALKPPGIFAPSFSFNLFYCRSIVLFAEAKINTWHPLVNTSSFDHNLAAMLFSSLPRVLLLSVFALSFAAAASTVTASADNPQSTACGDIVNDPKLNDPSQFISLALETPRI